MTIGDKRAFRNANKVFKIIEERKEGEVWYETIKFYDERGIYELEHNELLTASRELTDEEKERYKDR